MAEPSDADEIEPVKVAQSLGYITIGTMWTRGLVDAVRAAK